MIPASTFDLSMDNLLPLVLAAHVQSLLELHSGLRWRYNESFPLDRLKFDLDYLVMSFGLATFKLSKFCSF